MRERCTNTLFHSAIRKGVIVHPDAVDVLQILHLSHGVEWDQDLTIRVVIAALLHLGSKNANNLEAHAIESNLLADCVPPREEFRLGVRTDYRYTCSDFIIVIIEEASHVDGIVENFLDIGVVAIHRKSECSIFELHRVLLVGRRTHVLGQRNGARDVLHILDLETDFRSCFRTTCLHGRAIRPYADDLCSPIGEDSVDGAPETSAIGQQEHYSGDAPRHSQHGKRGTATVMLHRSVCLSEQIANHNYSFRSASTGCSIAALRAG